MFKLALHLILFSTIMGAFLLITSTETLAGGYTWTDEQGVTHFSDKKPNNTAAGGHEESRPAQFKEDAARSFERRYNQICGNILNLNRSSVTLLDIYIEQLTGLQREVATDDSLSQRERTTVLTRLDACIPRLLSAKETAKRREGHEDKVQDVLERQMQRFDKLGEVVAQRLEERRSSSMARGVEGAKFYSDLRQMGDNPLRYGMTKQDVSRLWGEPMRSRPVKTRAGQMDRVSYPLGIDLYFRDGLLETWGWRE